MKILYSWLKDYIDVNLTPEELEKKLNTLGIEVASITKTGADFEGVYAAKIEAILPHPNADKLHLVDLSAKDGAQRVVCGAQNIAVGQIVPLAKVGATLRGQKLTAAEIRGVVSEGMLCSADELGLAGERQKGIMILDKDIKIGADIKSLYGGDSDCVFELELTPNRPDLMSHLGVARELSVLLNIPLKEQKIKEVKGSGDTLKITLPCGQSGCPRYLGRTIKNVKNIASPQWLQKRLLAMDVNPKSALVDITNYVLYAVGHPLHAFDLTHLEGGQIIVRWAQEGEKFLGLDGVERALDKETLVIADGKKPVALAGVLGGAGDSILPTTKDIFLESAAFCPPCINKTSKKLGISTESSQRFERGVDIESCKEASTMATQLITEICGGEPSQINDVYPQKYEAKEFSFNPKEIDKILGVQTDKEKLKNIFATLAEKFDSSGELWRFAAKSYRNDLNHKWDLSEEAARFIGFDALPEGGGVTRTSIYFGENPKSEDMGGKMTSSLIGLGFLECKNFDFISKKDFASFGFNEKNIVEIKNPLAEGLEYLRPSLLISLLKNIAHNQRFGRHDLSLFEFGKTFCLQGGFPTEAFAVSGVMCGSALRNKFFLSKDCPVGFFGLKGVAQFLLEDYPNLSFAQIKQPAPYLHPKLSLEIFCDGKSVGVLGKAHPSVLKTFDVKGDVFVFEIFFKNLEKYFNAQEFKTAKDISVYPPSKRDLSLVIDKSVTYEAVQKVLNAFAGQCKYQLIDLYAGENLPEGKKSVSLRFEFSSDEKTLNDKEVNALTQNIISHLGKTLGAALR